MSIPAERSTGFRDTDRYRIIRWLGDQRIAFTELIWVFEYVLKYVVPEERTPPIYHRWLHQMLLERSTEGYVYRFNVLTGEGVVIDTKTLGDIDNIDPGEVLVNLSKAYLVSYRERIRALDAYDVESFDLKATLEKMYSEIHRADMLPTRVVLLETLRDHGDMRELNQSIFHVNWIYVMEYR